MKISTASATVCVVLALAALAADQLGPDSPKPPAAKPPAKPATAPPGKPDATSPRILTLEVPRLAPATPANPAPAPHAAAPGKPAMPPNLTLAPTQDPGSAIALEQLPAPVAPGIYTASPYTGIVVVPELMDEAMVKPVGPGSSKMPTRAPELKLTPKTK